MAISSRLYTARMVPASATDVAGNPRVATIRAASSLGLHAITLPGIEIESRQDVDRK